MHQPTPGYHRAIMEFLHPHTLLQERLLIWFCGVRQQPKNMQTKCLSWQGFPGSARTPPERMRVNDKSLNILSCWALSLQFLQFVRIHQTISKILWKKLASIFIVHQLGRVLDDIFNGSTEVNLRRLGPGFAHGYQRIPVTTLSMWWHYLWY